MTVATDILKRPQNLAFIFQETLTAIVRLRSGRQQPSDAERFRSQMVAALKTAGQEARSAGYSDNTIKLAVFAVTAFLDESVLNLHHPLFAKWEGNPVGLELFDRNISGEDFFKYLRRLLTQQDSPELGDLLEVYELCLLAGYRGEYGIKGTSDVASVVQAIRQKKARIRTDSPDFTDAWKLPVNENLPPQSDAWLRRLVITGAVCLGLVVILYIGFSLSLNSAMRDLRTINAEGRR